jgi:flagellin
MRELSVQAANDTNTDSDRAAIQNEIDALTSEVDRIANDTNFNSDIYPLTSGSTKNVTLDVSAFPTTTLSIKNTTKANFVCDGVTYKPGETITIDGALWLDTKKNRTVVTIGEINSGNSLHALYGIPSLNTASTTISNLLTTSTAVYDANTTYYLSYVTPDDLEVDDDGYLFVRYPDWVIPGWNVTPSKLYITDWGDYGLLSINSKGSLTEEEAEQYNCLNISDLVPDSENNSLWIQTGAQKDQGILLTLVDATAKGIGITNPSLDVTDYAGASASISRLDSAISKVSTYRSSFGAQQNRLTHAEAVDDTTAENTQAAESRIRDADMAAEMVNYSMHSIVEQAGQAMLTQANQNPQGILALLS